MSTSNDCANKVLNLMYRASAWANVADNAASSPLTLVYLGAHTGNLTAATNSQAENEATFTNYARVSTLRSTDWDAAATGANANSNLIQFPACGATANTISHISTGVGSSGATAVWHYGALNSPVDVSNNITLQFEAGAITISIT